MNDTQNKQDRLTLAGKALQGLLASQNDDKGWDMNVLAVVSLKIADTVLHFSNLEKLPDLSEPGKEQERPALYIEPGIVVPVEQPSIITP